MLELAAENDVNIAVTSFVARGNSKLSFTSIRRTAVDSPTMTSMSMNALTHLQEQKDGLVKKVTGTIAMVNAWIVYSLVARAALGALTFRFLYPRLTRTSLDRASSLAPYLKT